MASLGFTETRILSRDFRKYIQVSIFMKIRPVGVEFFHANWRTDIAKIAVSFRNITNAPKNSKHFLR